MVVTGRQFKGMSINVVTPPAAVRTRARLEAFPLGAPWFVEMHVAVHEP